MGNNTHGRHAKTAAPGSLLDTIFEMVAGVPVDPAMLTRALAIYDRFPCTAGPAAEGGEVMVDVGLYAELLENDLEIDTAQAFALARRVLAFANTLQEHPDLLTMGFERVIGGHVVLGEAASRLIVDAPVVPLERGENAVLEVLDHDFILAGLLKADPGLKN